MEPISTERKAKLTSVFPGTSWLYTIDFKYMMVNFMSATSEKKG
jgi:hypothetical protein